MQKAKCPPLLYRYRRIDEKGWLEGLITRGEHYFARPSEFNDPFECRPLTHYDPRGPKTREHIAKRARQIWPHESPARRLQRTEQLLRRFREPRQLKADGYSNLADRVGILCLVERPDNLLMWAHYGAAHQGVCIEFDTSEWLFRVAGQVQYSDTYPVVDTANQTPQAVAESFLWTKSKDWHYEEEWRIISYPLNSPSTSSRVREVTELMRGPGLHVIPRKLIRRIIFGLKTPQSAIEQVQIWTRDSGLMCGFARCLRVEGKFSLAVRDMECR